MSETGWPRFLPAGDAALVVEFGEAIDPEINRSVHALAKILFQEEIAGLGEAVPTYRSLLVHYDPLQIDYAEVLEILQDRLARVGEVHEEKARLVEIPTVYGGDYGPDLESVAREHGLTLAEVIRIHTETLYRVYMIGFTPGFPYMGEVDERIATPRLSSQRTHVPAGSVGIAGKQTGIYPIGSPGGWQILGYTPLHLFDPNRVPPSLLSPGDQVRFVPISLEDLSRDA